MTKTLCFKVMHNIMYAHVLYVAHAFMAVAIPNANDMEYMH